MPGICQDNVAVKGPKVVRPVEPEDKQLLLVVVLYQVGKHRRKYTWSCSIFESN